MIGIRSITYNYGTKELGDAHTIRKIQKCVAKWDRMNPHTQRLNLQEVSETFPVKNLSKLLDLCNYSSIRWINVPLNLLKSEKKEEMFQFASELLKYSGRIFVNIIGMENGTMDSQIWNDYAKLVHRAGAIEYTGITNFRLGLSFGIGYDCPFFPFTRAKQERITFSIALEMVETINEYLQKNQLNSMEECQSEIIRFLTEQIKQVYKTAIEIGQESGIPFSGFDFSLAPQIGKNGSVIAILQELGVFNFGKSGTMFATAFLTDILKELANQFPSVGFSGVMYSLLEDLELCAINNDRGIDIEDFISVSTMCGCGLDMVPITSDTSSDEIRTLCMDIAGISSKYKKPLGIRLLSIPGTKRDRESYTSMVSEADFVANTKVMKLNVNLLMKHKLLSFQQYGKK